MPRVRGQRQHRKKDHTEPRRRKPRPAPIQLALFEKEASLIRIRPERNEFRRYYRMEVWPDLFGRALLARHWGRLDPQPDPGAAINALAALAHQKRRRGYQERAA